MLVLQTTEMAPNKKNIKKHTDSQNIIKIKTPIS